MKTKHLFLLLFAVVAFTFNSCKKDTVDVTRLLTSVPSSASGVIVLNLENMIQDTGSKIKDHEVILSPEMSNILKKASSIDADDFNYIFEGNAGIDLKGAVVFYDANRTFITFALFDVDKFCNFVEEKGGGKFSDEGSGVKVCGAVAVKGAQAWICISKGKKIDPDAIAAYSELADYQSFLVTPMGEKLLVAENDIRGWAKINIFVDDILRLQDRSLVTLGLGFLFEDADAVAFKADFEKGELESEIKILNNKGEFAKYQLPTDKLDIAAIKSIGGTCEGLMAFTVNSKLIKKFDQLGAAFGGALFGGLGDMFKNIDGTIGIAAGEQLNGETVKGIVTTKGEASSEFRDFMANNIAPVTPDGKYLRFSKGDVSGSLDVEACAEELKGACVGIVLSPAMVNNMEEIFTLNKGFKYIALKLEPESGGIEIEIKMPTIDPKENALLLLLQ